MKEIKMDEITKNLLEAGFVRVTGLTSYLLQWSLEPEKITGEMEPRYGYNNGVHAIHPGNGDVWIAIKPNFKKVEEIISTFKLKNGAGVPCSNGECIVGYEILSRIVDYKSLPELV